MKRTILIAAGLGLVLGTAAPIGAEEAGTMLHGQVTGKTGDTLTVRQQGGNEVRVRATDDTAISGRTGELGLDDIETGDRVRVTTASAEPGEHVAREIRVETRAGMGGAEGEPPALPTDPPPVGSPPAPPVGGPPVTPPGSPR